MNWVKDSNLHQKMRQIVVALNLKHIDPERVVMFRSSGSRSSARARIWAFPRIIQLALDVKPHYCIEVLDEKFSRLNKDDQERTIIHELLHIPKTFSGALVPHKRRGWRLVKEAEMLFQQYKNNY